MEKNIKRAKELYDRVSALYAGFDSMVAKWLLGHGYNHISVCIDADKDGNPHLEQLMVSVILPAKVKSGVKVNGFFTSSKDKWRLTHTHKNSFSSVQFQPFESSKVKAGELFVFVSFEENAGVKGDVEKAGAKFIKITDLLDEALNYATLEASAPKAAHDSASGAKYGKSVQS